MGTEGIGVRERVIGVMAKPAEGDRQREHRPRSLHAPGPVERPAQDLWTPPDVSARRAPVGSFLESPLGGLGGRASLSPTRRPRRSPSSDFPYSPVSCPGAQSLVEGKGVSRRWTSVPASQATSASW